MRLPKSVLIALGIGWLLLCVAVVRGQSQQLPPNTPNQDTLTGGTVIPPPADRYPARKPPAPPP